MPGVVGPRVSVAALLLMVTIFGFSSVLVEAQAEAADLEGAHVCYCWRWTIVYELVNVTYSCWNVERLTGEDCEDYEEDQEEEEETWEVRHGHHHHRWKRTWGSDWYRSDEDYDDDYEEETVCYVHSLKTCTRQETRCFQRYERVEYCCNGYEEDGMGGCRKTIECRVNNGGCEQMCKGSYSGHRCECMPGYKLVDNTRCVDINECTDGTAGCKFGCNNTDGSYFCTCPPGYDMTSATECKERNECLLGNGGCEHRCVDTERSFYCECDDGFTLENGNECHDVDECDLHNGGCSDGCTNHYGSYRCTCPDDQMLATDGKTCITGVERTTPFREPLRTEASRGPFSTDDFRPSPPTGAEQKSQSLDGGTIAGITLGILIGLAALAVLLCLLCCLCRRWLARNAAAAGVAAPPAAGAGGQHIYTQAVLPLPIKKKIPLDGTVVTPGDEKSAYTNLAFDNEVYGTVWEDIPVTTKNTPAATEPDVTPPAETEHIYDNVEVKKDKPPLPEKGQGYDNVLNEMKKDRMEQ